VKLRLCILIYNDSSYAAEVHYCRRQGYAVDIVWFPEADFAAIARYYGASARDGPNALRSRPAEVLGCRRRRLACS
jgi:thiamine pyrophosphate-dependent acetolactate synthase large subunit-like protein